MRCSNTSALVEAARLAAAQHVRRQVQVGVAGREQRRRVPGEAQARQLHAVGQRDLDVARRARGVGRRAARARAAALRLPAEVPVDQRARLGRIEVAGDDQAGVRRPVEALEERAHVGDGGRLQIRVRADRRPVVGVVRRVHRLRDRQLGAAVGAVLVRLAALVLHHLALPLQLLVGDHVGQRRQPIGLQPQERLEQVARADLVVVRAIVAGGAVVVAAPALHDRVERRVGRVARAHEHQVLEQVREAGPPGRLRPSIRRGTIRRRRRAGSSDPRGGSPSARSSSTNVSNAIVSIGGAREPASWHESAPARRLNALGLPSASAPAAAAAASRLVALLGRARATRARERRASGVATASCCRPTSRRRSCWRPTSASSSPRTPARAGSGPASSPQTSFGYLYGVGPPPRDRFYALSPDDGAGVLRRRVVHAGSASGGALATAVASDFFVDRTNADRVARGRGDHRSRRRRHRRRRRCSRRPTAGTTFGATPLYTAPAGANIVSIEIARSNPHGHLPGDVHDARIATRACCVRPTAGRRWTERDVEARARRQRVPHPGRRPERRATSSTCG